MGDYHEDTYEIFRRCPPGCVLEWHADDTVTIQAPTPGAVPLAAIRAAIPGRTIRGVVQRPVTPAPNEAPARVR